MLSESLEEEEEEEEVDARMALRRAIASPISKRHRRTAPSRRGKLSKLGRIFATTLASTKMDC